MVTTIEDTPAGSSGTIFDAPLSATPDPGLPKDSPEWWLAKLEPKLNSQRASLQTYEDYYRGNQRLAFATEQFKKAFGNTFKAFADNFMKIVVSAVDQRLKVEGFRIPTEKADPSAPPGPDPNADPEELTTGDSEAWDMWQASQLDSESKKVHRDALKLGKSYVIVGPGEDGNPLITGESAMEVICSTDPGYRRKRTAALKRWKGEDDLYYATVYLPDEIAKFVSSSPARLGGGEITWKRRQVAQELWPMPNPLGVVPVVPFCNRPELTVECESEIAELLPLQDAINYLFTCMLVAAEYMGFPQRWITGIEIPSDPETNQPLDMWKMALDRVLMSEDPATAFGSLPSADLANYTGAIAMGVQHLATQSSTPPHYFLASMGNFPSGESLKAAETGLVAKVRDQMPHFGESWEEVIRLGFLIKKDTAKAKASISAETIWKDPESRTESEHIDAMVKMGSLGVPEEFLWEKSGLFEAEEIARMKEYRALKEAQAAAAKTPTVQMDLTPGVPAVNVAPSPVNVSVPPAPPTNKRLVHDAAGNLIGIDTVPAGG